MKDALDEAAGGIEHDLEGAAVIERLGADAEQLEVEVLLFRFVVIPHVPWHGGIVR
jgi:hypothetical protein